MARYCVKACLAMSPARSGFEILLAGVDSPFLMPIPLPSITQGACLAWSRLAGY